MSEKPLFSWLGTDLECASMKSSLEAWKATNGNPEVGCEDIIWEPEGQ